MSGAAAGAGGAAAAAAIAAMQREEEQETSYMPNDLDGDWEFKILRSNTGAFRKPETMREALREEAAAGWVLLEKLDNSRLRLKRPRAAGQQDGGLALDPYRTYYGIGQGRLALIVILVLMAVMILGTLIAVASR